MDPGLRAEDWLGRLVHVVIDRPLNSHHPQHADMLYPVNYGYVPGTVAPDGHPIDAYVVGTRQPLGRCSGPVVAVVRRRDDVEDKLVVALAGRWDQASISAAVAFQERYFDSWIEVEPRS